MLYFPQTRIDLSKERPIAQGYNVYAEGSALTWKNVGGQLGVAPTTGTNDQFAGVSFNSVINALTVPYVETLTVSANGQINTSFAANAGTLAIVNASNTLMTAAAADTDPTTLTATQYAPSSTNPLLYSFNASLNAGAVVTVAYRYSPNSFQNMYLQGMQLPGGAAGLYLGQIDVIQHGDVYTSEYDTSVNWSTATGVVLEANGLFGASTSIANNLPGVTIIALPSAGNPFLGLAINVA